MTAVPGSNRPPSHLFYQTGARRPRIDLGRGHPHVGRGRPPADRTARRARWWSTSAIPTRLCSPPCGRSLPASPFAYRLHFENEPAETLAARLCEKMPAGLDRVFFVSGGSEATESCLKLARQYAVANGPGRALQGDRPVSELPRLGRWARCRSPATRR